MDQKKELTLEEMDTVIGAIKASSPECQLCPKCGKLFPNKDFLRHLALCDGKKAGK